MDHSSFPKNSHKRELANGYGETYIQKAKEEINGKEIIKWIKPKATNKFPCQPYP
jgi:hypothetical protein